MKPLLILVIAFFLHTQSMSQYVEFAKPFAGPPTSINACCDMHGPVVRVDPEGNSIVAGYFFDTVEFSMIPGTFRRTSNGARDMYILKMNPQGEITWLKTFGGTGIDEAIDIVLDEEGNIYVVALFSNTVFFSPGPGAVSLSSNGQKDIAIFKLNSEGLVLWAKSLGSTMFDRPGSICLHDNGQTILVSGTMVAPPAEIIDYNPDSGQHLVPSSEGGGFILKLTRDGEYIWSKNYPTGGNLICVDPFNQIWLTSAFSDVWDFDPGPDSLMVGPSFLQDNYTLKLDETGNQLSVFFMGGSYAPYMQQMLSDSEGNIYQVGTFWPSLELDPGPATYWVHTPDMGSDPFHYPNIFVRKLNNEGTFLWGHTTGGLDAERWVKLTLDEDENIYLAGNFYYHQSFDPNGVDFDPGPNTHFLTPGSQRRSGFLQKLNSDGDFQWASAFVPEKYIGSVLFNSILYHANSNSLYLAGFIADTVDMDPGSGTYLIAPVQNSGSAFLLKFGLGSVGVDEALLSPFSLYPNPATEMLTLEFTGLIQQIRSVELLNSLGQVVYQNLPASSNSQGSTIFIPVQGLLPGMYFCRVTTDQGSTSRKVVIE